MKQLTFLQRWFCEACGKKGTVRMGKHEGVWGGYVMLVEAHRKKAPTCVGIIRIVVPYNAR